MALCAAGLESKSKTERTYVRAAASKKYLNQMEWRCAFRALQHKNQSNKHSMTGRSLRKGGVRKFETRSIHGNMRCCPVVEKNMRKNYVCSTANEKFPYIFSMEMFAVCVRASKTTFKHRYGWEADWQRALFEKKLLIISYGAVCGCAEK